MIVTLLVRVVISRRRISLNQGGGQSPAAAAGEKEIIMMTMVMRRVTIMIMKLVMLVMMMMMLFMWRNVDRGLKRGALGYERHLLVSTMGKEEEIFNVSRTQGDVGQIPC